MTPARRRLTRLLLWTLLGYTVLSLWQTAFFIGFADFPCSEHLSKDGSCVVGRSFVRDAPNTTTYRIEAFLTVYRAGWSGGGCDYSKTETDELSIRTAVGRLRFRLDGRALSVNQRRIDPGETLRRARYWHWNPWVVSRLQLQYQGAVPDCDAETTVARAVIVGRYGTEFSAVKGTIVLVLIIIGLRATRVRGGPTTASGGAT